MVKWEREHKMINNSYKGKFIVFEGIDGCGKSTQVKLLANYLKKKKKKILITDEPTKGPIGKLTRKALANKIKIDNLGLQMLFMADRAHHLQNEVIPYLKKGYIVICDRYAFSTIAYGGIKLDINWFITANKFFLLPDFTFILKINPKQSLLRLKKSRSQLEIFEKIKILKRASINYQKISKVFNNCYLIDGEKSIEEVFNQIKKIIDQKIK